MEPRGVYCLKKEIDHDTPSQKSKQRLENAPCILKTWSSLLTGSLQPHSEAPHYFDLLSPSSPSSSLVPFILATPFCGHTLWFVLTCYCVTPEMMKSNNTLCDCTPSLPSHARKSFQCTKLFAIKPFCKLIPFLSIYYSFPFHSSTFSQETWTT